MMKEDQFSFCAVKSIIVHQNNVSAEKQFAVNGNQINKPAVIFWSYISSSSFPDYTAGNENVSGGKKFMPLFDINLRADVDLPVGTADTISVKKNENYYIYFCYS